jgi:hypothetical protein
VAAGLVSLVAAASVLAQSGSVFPSSPGSTWEYAGTAGGRPIKMSASVVSSKTSGGSTTFVVKWMMDGRQASQETYILSASQLVRAAAGNDGKTDLNPPLPVIKLPAKVGQTWTWKGSMKTGGGQIEATAELKTAAKVDLKTPAGTFSAWKVDMKLVISGITITNTYWFAPGKGLVKQSTTVPGQNGQPVVVEGSLTKYTAK